MHTTYYQGRAHTPLTGGSDKTVTDNKTEGAKATECDNNLNNPAHNNLFSKATDFWTYLKYNWVAHLSVALMVVVNSKSAGRTLAEHWRLMLNPCTSDYQLSK